MIQAEVEPEVTMSQIKFMRPGDYLENAKSIMVLGLNMPQGAIDSCARYDGEAVGSYAFVTYQSQRLLYLAALHVTKALHAQGYSAHITSDLSGTAGMTANSRGIQADVFSNRFAAVAAGMGRLSNCGFVLNPEHGASVRHLAIVTDAELAETPLCTDELAAECSDCQACVSACKTQAFMEPIEFSLGPNVETFHRIDVNRCEWAKRYSFIPESGNQFMGWNFDIKAPQDITEKNLSDAMKQTPPISKHHACSFERCFMSCTLVRTQ